MGIIMDQHMPSLLQIFAKHEFSTLFVLLSLMETAEEDLPEFYNDLFNLLDQIMNDYTTDFGERVQ